jgi:CheY-like chemotaxis protein
MTDIAPRSALAYRRVLVVEDEYFLADDMAQALQTLGAEVVGPVPTRDGALALLASELVDVAVLDINLKGETVYPVADALREQGVPFVFATGYDQRAVPDAYKDVKRWEKPFKPEDLAEALPGIMQKA